MNKYYKYRLGTAFVVVALVFLTGCASTENRSSSEDPLEPINRAVFGFNDAVDGVVLKPVAQGYRKVTPDYFEETFARFFGNIGDVGNSANALLQGKFSQAGNDGARVLINTTFGIGGLFDIAEPWGFEKSDGEDFGQTLAVWGVGRGPYVVLPILGPSSARGSVGLVGDYFLDPVSYIDDDETRIGLTALETVTIRAGLLDAEALVSGDRYTFIREAYLQRRQFLINDGQVEDDFGEDLDFLDE